MSSEGFNARCKKQLLETCKDILPRTESQVSTLNYTMSRLTQETFPFPMLVPPNNEKYMVTCTAGELSGWGRKFTRLMKDLGYLDREVVAILES